MAAMAAVTAAPTVADGAADNMWAEVIFFYYLHNSMHRCDKFFRRMAKHLSVLWQTLYSSVLFGKTLECFVKHLIVLNLLRLFVEYTFRRTPIFSKMR